MGLKVLSPAASIPVAKTLKTRLAATFNVCYSEAFIGCA
jgi:hypothetical protein